jgi:hypothetical protein
MTPDDMEGRLALRLRVDPDFVSVQVDREDLRALLLDYQERGRALGPFAVLSDKIGEGWTDETPAFAGADGVVITVGQLRRARATLKGKSHD